MEGKKIQQSADYLHLLIRERSYFHQRLKLNWKKESKICNN